jgi:multidrug efflux pump subunit AcrA (membrane-fusion protein)
MRKNSSYNITAHNTIAHNRRRVPAFLPALAAAAAAAVIAFSGCGRGDGAAGKGPGGPGGPGAPAAIFAVNTTTAVQGQIRDYIALSGDIVAGSTVDVYSDAAGKVAAVYVAVGQRVTKGQRIAAVDPSRPGMDYQFGIAEAPISGTVVSLPAQVGMTISQAVPVARISGGGALEIKLYVAERFISKMALNLPCEITLDAWPGDVFQGSVSEVAPTVDPASRTMEVRVNVNNQGSKLKAGMFAKVRIITERKNNIVKIPAQAVINRFGEQYVFVVDELPPDEAQAAAALPEEKKGGPSARSKKQEAEAAPETTALPVKLYAAKKRLITPGILIDGALEVLQGIAPNEEIVIRGQTLLEDGSHINIVDKTAPLSAN